MIWLEFPWYIVSVPIGTWVIYRIFWSLSFILSCPFNFNSFLCLAFYHLCVTRSYSVAWAGLKLVIPLLHPQPSEVSNASVSLLGCVGPGSPYPTWEIFCISLNSFLCLYSASLLSLIIANTLFPFCDKMTKSSLGEGRVYVHLQVVVYHRTKAGQEPATVTCWLALRFMLS